MILDLGKSSLARSVTSKSCPKIISLEKWKFLTPLKLPKNVCHLGKIIVATGFEKLPKVQ